MAKKSQITIYNKTPLPSCMACGKEIISDYVYIDDAGDIFHKDCYLSPKLIKIIVTNHAIQQFKKRTNFQSTDIKIKGIIRRLLSDSIHGEVDDVRKVLSLINHGFREAEYYINIPRGLVFVVENEVEQNKVIVVTVHLNDRGFVKKKKLELFSDRYNIKL